jgi:hypothetical protein
VPPTEKDRTVGELVLDVSERVSILVREEIELAKTEVTEKVTELLKGGAVAAAAGIFVLCALGMLMFFGAFLINDILGVETAVWAGFLIEAIIFLLIAAAAGFFAKKAIEKGSSPAPTMAIEEVKETKDILGGSTLEEAHQHVAEEARRAEEARQAEAAKQQAQQAATTAGGNQ